MQGIDATFDHVAFEDDPGPRRNLPQFVLIAAAVATVGCVSALALRARLVAPPPPAVIAPPAPATAVQPLPKISAADFPSAQMAAADFGPMIIEPGWIQPKTPAPPEASLIASLEPAPTNAAGADSVPPATAARLPDVIPLPPERDAPEIGDTFPMPPARPSELNAPVIAAPERQVPQPGVEVGRTPGDKGNIFQKLWGALNQPARPGVAPPAPTPAMRTVAPAVTPPAQVARPPAVASAPLESRTGNSRSSSPSPLAFFSQKLFGSSGPPSGYDRYTAVYDISARTLYMPDGSRIEAHSGLGSRLDNPRYVSERAKGPTPPHVYELTMRESLFHGVQAIRLNPVGGEGGIYGRAGLLAHPYMLGPNGDSNGCVSVKDYEAFLRAFQSGEIKRLAVVASL